MSKKILSILLTLTILIGILSVIPITANAAEADLADAGFESTGWHVFDEFINDPRWTDGVYWWGDYSGGQEPLISKYKSSGCGAYAADFVKYCYGTDDLRGGTEYHDVNEVMAGDVIHIGYNDNGHWFVVLMRVGNDLYTAEGNFSSHVRVGWNYTISGDRFAQDNRHFDVGYHYDFDCDYEYTVLEDGTAKIKKYYGPGGDITVPTYLGGHLVTSIGLCAFYSSINLTSVIIPTSVTRIERSAFACCDKLESITIPDSVTFIGYEAFWSTKWYSNQPEGVVYAGKMLIMLKVLIHTKLE